jgi:hypothetical protein
MKKKTRNKAEPVATRSVHIRKDLQIQVATVATSRDEYIQDIVEKALLAYLPELQPFTQSSSN